MDDWRIDLSPILRMALNAKRLDIRIVKKLHIFRAMGSVTAETIQREIPIPRINDFGAERVAGMGLPIVALGTAGDRGSLFLQKDIVRSVRGMADRALPIVDRLMFGL